MIGIVNTELVLHLQLHVNKQHHELDVTSLVLAVMSHISEFWQQEGYAPLTLITAKYSSGTTVRDLVLFIHSKLT